MKLIARLLLLICLATSISNFCSGYYLGVLEATPREFELHVYLYRYYAFLYPLLYVVSPLILVYLFYTPEDLAGEYVDVIVNIFIGAVIGSLIGHFIGAFVGSKSLATTINVITRRGAEMIIIGSSIGVIFIAFTSATISYIRRKMKVRPRKET